MWENERPLHHQPLDVRPVHVRAPRWAHEQHTAFVENYFLQAFAYQRHRWEQIVVVQPSDGQRVRRFCTPCRKFCYKPPNLVAIPTGKQVSVHREIETPTHLGEQVFVQLEIPSVEKLSRLYVRRIFGRPDVIAMDQKPAFLHNVPKSQREPVQRLGPGTSLFEDIPTYRLVVDVQVDNRIGLDGGTDCFCQCHHLLCRNMQAALFLCEPGLRGRNCVLRSMDPSGLGVPYVASKNLWRLLYRISRIGNKRLRSEPRF